MSKMIDRAIEALIREKLEKLTYHINEIEGCYQEFRSTPCQSLENRLEEAILRAKYATKVKS